MFKRNLAAAIRIAFLTALLPVSLLAEDRTNRFGFTGPEIFPIENQISQVRCADFDGDGLRDLVVVNNARSRITFLYNYTGRTNLAELKERFIKRDINDLPPDSRFRIESIASEKRISSLAVADLNGDERPDLAYYGEPKELIVQYNEGTNKWSAPKRFPIEDGSLDPYALVSGDINGDHRADLLLLGESQIYFFAQKPDGTLAEPTKFPFVGVVKSLQVLDVQGDGRDDLLLVNWDNPNPFRFRLQNPSGKLGPEIHFNLSPIRSYWADDLDGDGRTEIITIAQKSGRAQVSSFQEKPAEELSGAWKRGQFQMMPLTRTAKTRRGIVWADLNADGRTDLLVAEPEAGQLALSLQNEDGSLDAPRNSATLTGILDLLAADWNGDGRPEIFALSGDERQVAVTFLDENGRLGFPKPVFNEGRPLAMAAGKLKFGENLSIAAVMDLDGKRELQIKAAKSEIFRQKLSENFKGTPAAMIAHDVDQDGRLDLVILVPYEKMRILLQQKEGDFKEIEIAAPGGNPEQPWVGSADVDADGKPELLLPQRNFLRAVVLQPDGVDRWTFDVKEQINGAESNSRLLGAAGVEGGGRSHPAIFLFDAERKTISISERNSSGTWQVTRNVPLPFGDFQAVQSFARGEGRPPAIALNGLNVVGWLPLDGAVWDLAELDSYETPIKDGFLHDVVSGDLNGDKRKDLVFLETAKSYLDLVTFEEPHQLVPANRWQVFEERTFRSRRNELPEPREAIIADVTGDGKNDLIVVVHDRVLVYPQE